MTNMFYSLFPKEFFDLKPNNNKKNAALNFWKQFSHTKKKLSKRMTNDLRKEKFSTKKNRRKNLIKNLKWWVLFWSLNCVILIVYK